MCILGKPLKQQNCRTMIKLTFFEGGGGGGGGNFKTTRTQNAISGSRARYAHALSPVKGSVLVNFCGT